MRCLSVIALLALAAAPATAQPSESVGLVELMRGTWKIVGDDGNVVQDCDKGQHFEPSADGHHVLLSEVGTDFSADYHVIHAEGGRILSYIEGEDRLTDEGDPVLWWAYFKDRDHFVWRRYDWPENNATAAEWVRCSTESSAE
jgi:hypothetical protein